MEGGWKTPPPPPSATTRQKSPVLIGLSGVNSFLLQLLSMMWLQNHSMLTKKRSTHPASDRGKQGVALNKKFLFHLVNSYNWVAVRRTYVFTLQEVEKICRILQSHVMLVWTIRNLALFSRF